MFLKQTTVIYIIFIFMLYCKTGLSKYLVDKKVVLCCEAGLCKTTLFLRTRVIYSKAELGKTTLFMTAYDICEVGLGINPNRRTHGLNIAN